MLFAPQFKRIFLSRAQKYFRVPRHPPHVACRKNTNALAIVRFVVYIDKRIFCVLQ